MIVAPVKPPTAAWPLNALSKIIPKAAGTSEIFDKRMINEPAIYNIAMIGTNLLATVPMRLIPPSMTKAANPAITSPVVVVLISKLLWSASATELDCTILPIPNAATVPNSANRKPSQCQFLPRPFLM